MKSTTHSTVHTHTQTQPQDPTPHRDRPIMRRTTALGREARDRTGEGGGGAKKRKKPQKSYYRGEVENGGDLDGRRKKRIEESVGSVDVDRGYLVLRHSV